MTQQEKNKRWYDRYSNEVKNMTNYYNSLNNNAKVITREPTEEELKIIHKAISKKTSYFNPLVSSHIN